MLESVDYKEVSEEKSNNFKVFHGLNFLVIVNHLGLLIYSSERT